MPLYQYTGDLERHYHDLGTVAPDDRRELLDDPGDGRWRLVEVKEPQPKEVEK